MIGGGIAGLTVAWELARRGLEVFLVDRGAIGAREPWAPASASSVGVLSAPRRGRSPLKRLQSASHRLYPSFVESLRAVSGLDPGYRVPGSLHLVEDLPPEGAREKKARIHREAGVECRWVGPPEMERLCPGLGPRFQAAMVLPSEAIVDPRMLLAALQVACEREGVTFREGAGPASLHVEGGRTVLRLAGGETLRGATYVVAAGAWSGEVVAALYPGGAAFETGAGEEAGLPIRPIRGQVLGLRLDRELGPNLRFRPRDLEREYHVVTRGPGTFWVGSTVEDVGFDGRVTEDGTDELLRAARDALGEVGVSEMTERWAGLRPQARRPGGPFLGPLPFADDVWVHGGHYRSGILLAPLTARLLGDALLGEPTPVPGLPGDPPLDAREIIEALRPARGAV